MRRSSKKKKHKRDSKNNLYKITHRLYNEIRENPEALKLKKLRGYQGEYDMTTENILVDYRKMFFPTLIHEYFHKWNEEKNETWILNKERTIINSISVRQIVNLIKILAMSLSSREK